MRRAHPPLDPRAGVLFLLQGSLDAEVLGGTEAHVRDLVQVLGGAFRCHVGIVRGDFLIVDAYEPIQSRVERRGSWMFRCSEGGYAATLGGVLRDLDIRVLHLHQLQGHDLEGLNHVLGEFPGLKLVTAHDFLPLCLNPHLLYKGAEYCGVPEDLQTCADCLAATLGKSLEALAHHRDRYKTLLERVDGVVFPSESIARPIARFHALDASKIHVVPHGVGLDAAEDGVPAYQGGVLKIAYIGALLPHKGVETLKQAIRENRLAEVEWHVWGAPRLEDAVASAGRVVQHGPYERAQISALLRREGIHLGILPAILPESYSFTLSEFYTQRIPVLGSQLGAIGERITRDATGWTFAPGDAQGLLATVERICREPECLAATRATGDFSVPPLDEMGRRYRALYETRVQTDSTAPMDPARLRRGRRLAKLARTFVVRYELLRGFAKKYGARRTLETAFGLLAMRLKSRS